MLDGGIIQRLLEEKWKTFARVRNSVHYLLILDKYNIIIISEPIPEAFAHPIHSSFLPVAVRLHAPCNREHGNQS